MLMVTPIFAKWACKLAGGNFFAQGARDELSKMNGSRARRGAFFTRTQSTSTRAC